MTEPIPTSAFLSQHGYETSIIISDLEKLNTGDQPRILTSRPDFVAPISLPLVTYGKSEVRYGMHTDMIGRLIGMLADLKDSTRSQLYIQGRMPDPTQWEHLQNNPAYEFFISGRSWRVNKDNQINTVDYLKQPEKEGSQIQKYIEMLVPKRLRLTPSQIRNYSHMQYGPDTTITGMEEIKSAWYQAEWIRELYSNNIGVNTNSYRSIWGGMNTFNIGSNTLVPGLIRKAAFSFRQQFEVAIGETSVDSIKPTRAMLAEFDIIDI